MVKYFQINTTIIGYGCSAISSFSLFLADRIDKINYRMMESIEAALLA